MFKRHNNMEYFKHINLYKIKAQLLPQKTLY